MSGPNPPRFPFITFTHTNYKGETAERRAVPRRLWFGSTEYHTTRQWLMEAYDLDRKAVRDFALNDCAFAAAPPDGRSRDTFDQLVAEGRATGEKAIEWHPAPNYSITKFAEEAGEVVKAAVHCAEGRESYGHLRDEMVDAIAMLYRLWVEGDQVHGLRPVHGETNP